jgi:hypothetical protein
MTHNSFFQLKEKSLEALQKINKKYIDTGLMYGWKSHISKTYDHGHWNKQILKESKHFPFDQSKMPQMQRHLEIQEIWNCIQEVIGERSLLRVYVNGYTYGTDGYAHLDDDWITKKYGNDALSETVIVYLNETWDKDWAGETVIFDDNDDIDASILPKFGRVLIFNSDKWHAARPVTRACGVLRKVLVFKTIDPKINSYEIEFLLERTKGLKHSGKTFFEHLYNTEIILEKMRMPKEVCAAGLFHSIYGTEFYKFENEIKNTNVVTDLIGQYAEKIVSEFCSLEKRYETIIHNLKQYDDEFRMHLAAVEYANLLDQNHLEEYNNKIESLYNLLRNRYADVV